MNAANDLLITGAAAVWTGLRGAGARLEGGLDIRIRGGRIAATGQLAPEPGETVLDARGGVVMPGWVNTHHHLFQSLLKGIPGGLDLDLMGWLSAVPVRWRRGFDQERTLRLAARVGLVELLLSGCTTVSDHQYHLWPGMGWDPSAAVFDEAARLGLRLVLARGGQTVSRMVDTTPSPQVQPETLAQLLAGLARDVERFHDPAPDAMRRVVCAPTTPTWSVLPDELDVIARSARELGVRLHSHLSETVDYVRYCREVHGCTPLEFVERHGWVGPDVWYAHMVHLSPAEVQRCAETGTGIAHCPQSNGRLGSGVAPLVAALAAGVPVGLAVDGAASNEAADMLSEAHACWLIHRALHGAAAMPVADVIHVGTAGGARVLGLDAVGTLQPGQAADLVIHALDDPAHFGLHDPGVAPVVSGRGRVRAVLVGGRLVAEDGAIPGLDLDALRAEAAAEVAALKSRLA